MLQIEDLDLNNKKVLIRVDFNVPITDGKIENNTRIQAAIPTIKLALEKNAAIILMSHLGQPRNYQYSAELSLKPVATELEKLLQQPVRFETNYLDGINPNPKPNEIILCENVRFNRGEMENDSELSKKMAALGDIFIMDAFGTAHRAQASTVGIAEFSPIAASGLLLATELNALEKALKNPKRPLVAIVGGAKVSSKLPVLKSLIRLVDVLILGGGIANTFIAAEGNEVGSSLYDPDLIPAAKELLQMAKEKNVQILIPKDVVVTEEIIDKAKTRIVNVNAILSKEKIVDVGPNSLLEYKPYLEKAGTILWNGPLGIFEIAAFANGTEALAESIANAKAFSIAGGGETLAAIDKFQIANKISYISTGGGAFLEFLEGKTLPAVAILEKRAKENTKVF